jgi:hypothetical protein
MNSDDNFDVEKLERLRERAAEARAVLRDISDRRHSALQEVADLQGRIRSQRRQFSGRANPNSEDALSRATAELERVTTLYREKGQAAEPLLALVARLEAWASARGWRADGYSGARGYSLDPGAGRAVSVITARTSA